MRLDVVHIKLDNDVGIRLLCRWRGKVDEVFLQYRITKRPHKILDVESGCCGVDRRCHVSLISRMISFNCVTGVFACAIIVSSFHQSQPERRDGPVIILHSNVLVGTGGLLDSVVALPMVFVARLGYIWFVAIHLGRLIASLHFCVSGYKLNIILSRALSYSTPIDGGSA
jgi:hypothetical protein